MDNAVYRAENPVKAIFLDLLESQRGIIKLPILCLKVRAEYQRLGGDCGDAEWQEFGLIGLAQWGRKPIKRRGFYDVAAKGYRAFVGSNRRQLLAGAQYKRQKGDENYVAADALERLADLLSDDEKVVTPDLYKQFRREWSTEDKEAA